MKFEIVQVEYGSDLDFFGSPKPSYLFTLVEVERSRHVRSEMKIRMSADDERLKTWIPAINTRHSVNVEVSTPEVSDAKKGPGCLDMSG